MRALVVEDEVRTAALLRRAGSPKRARGWTRRDGDVEVELSTKEFVL